MPIGILGQSLVNGILLGGLYALIAGGLTLIFGVIYIINFAHADFVMIGMYIAYWMFVLFGINPYVSIPVAATVMFAVGAIIQSTIIRPVLKASMLNHILLTMGLSSLIVGFAQFFWEARPRSIQLGFSSNRIVIAGLTFNIPRLAAFGIAVALTLGFYLFLKRTRTGTAIRACQQSRTAAQLMGIDVNYMYTLAFGIGTAFAGVAGVLLTPTYPVSPTVGLSFSFTAFVVVVLGTMGNFIGAFIGAMIIGVTEAFTGLFLGSELRQLGGLVIFVLVLLFKPGGLFGGRQQ